MSPLFALGAEALFKSILAKVKTKKPIDLKGEKLTAVISLVLTLIILVAFFLFQTGVIYEVSNDPAPSSFSLSYYKMQNSTWIVHESDVFSAQWLSNHGDIRNMATYADTVSLSHVLASYSRIDPSLIFLLSNTTGIIRGDGLISYVIPKVANTSYIYLRQFNVIYHTIQWDTRRNITYTYNELPILDSTGTFINKIYSNGASEIKYRSPQSSIT